MSHKALDPARWLDGSLRTYVERDVRTVEHDLPNEIDFLRRQDEARNRIMEIADMPDRLAQDLLVFVRQNSGAIPKERRKKEFAALTDEETTQIEAIYRDVFE